MGAKARQQQRQTDGRGLDQIGTRGRSPPAPTCCAKRRAQRPGNRTQAKECPLCGGIARTQLQLTIQIIHPEHGVRHKAEGIAGIGQKHHHHGRAPDRGTRCGACRGHMHRRDDHRRMHAYLSCRLPTHPGGHGAEQGQSQPDGTQAAACKHGHQRGGQQRTHTNAAEHQRPQGRTTRRHHSRHGHRRPQYHEGSPGNTRYQPPDKEHGHGQGQAATGKAQCHSHPADHQHAQGPHALGPGRSGQSPDQITQQIGSPQIGDLLATEPAGMHHLRHQCRIGKTCQPHTTERGHEAGQQERKFFARDHRAFPLRYWGKITRSAAIMSNDSK